MVLRDIFLHVDTSAACEARIDLALTLARQHGATVTGLSVIAHPYYAPRQGAEELQSAAMGALFRERAVAAGVEARWQSLDWGVVGVGMAEILVRQSHGSDLVIVGQGDGEGAGQRVPADLAERLVLGSGRPVLVVPHVGRFETVGSRVLVAWKRGREATRVLHDAIPLLARAGTVRLLSVQSSDPAGPDAADPWGDIREHLARHGVTAETELLPPMAMPLGDLLLNRVCDEGFDLLVMGAFAQPPNGGPVPGKAAAQILREMTVPVLMAH